MDEGKDKQPMPESERTRATLVAPVKMHAKPPLNTSSSRPFVDEVCGGDGGGGLRAEQGAPPPRSGSGASGCAVKFDSALPEHMQGAKRMLRKATPLPMGLEEQSKEHRHQLEIWGENPPPPEVDKADLASDALPRKEQP
eukprot:CAMPEP_0185848452 /NCGR_PEP_ID=MMETSP1354-20130828/3324_1 /TAXON_ID=708628 /ORGANISM="Erythrolobus madagascarensis, Strain CCMP3276" /LENGTH=139 /DNA_ID=CAMNT_0028548845 /DNA_START=146 /DNA_END=568 /DNA_ORIENTATION=-